MAVELLCAGHACFDLGVVVGGYPAENSKSEIREMREEGGGPAANAAYLAALWGMPTGFAGLVGDDPRGRRVREELQIAGADVSLLELRTGHITPMSIIIVNKENGSRTIVNRKAETGPYQPDPMALRAMSPRALLFDGHELPAALAAMEEFPEAVSILDAGSWREGTAALAKRVDYLAASERFALQATGLPGLAEESRQRECVRILRERYETVVVVTMGERGLIGDEGGGFFSMPAYPARAVDTTAAGDIFHGAFAWAIAREAPLIEALPLASMAASLSTRTTGGRASIPALERVREELAHVG
jgi:sugar/nucleoside kinase (ribokinase family)